MNINRYPNTACELLTSDVSMINDALADEEEVHIQKLYAFLDTDKTLNPLLASFFSKVMGLLIARKSDMVRSCRSFKFDKMSRFYKHILICHMGLIVTIHTVCWFTDLMI